MVSSIGIVILGCDKNTADAEHFAGALAQHLPPGTQIHSVQEPNSQMPPMDAVIIFTCAFITDAQEESVSAILEWVHAKEEWRNPARVFVAGCLPQRYREELEQSLPEVDGFAGVHGLNQLLYTIISKRTHLTTGPKRKRLDSHPYAFLKIADGCNRACSFCIIPKIKGRHRSTSKETLLADAAALLNSGVREINLVAQDLTAYGKDQRMGYRLSDLLKDLCALPGDFWIRCLYCYPTGINDTLLETMASKSKIVPYLDIPLQHISPKILKSMGRKETLASVRILLNKIRARLPNVALRTTMMVGFPGETEDDHKQMLDFIQEQSFTWVGAFKYSSEVGTPAASMRPRVSARIAQRRYEAVMELQAQITAMFNESRVGKHSIVLIEAYDPVMGLWRGRSASEAPEVDGMVWVEPASNLGVGQFRKVVFTRADMYDMYARTLDEGL